MGCWYSLVALVGFSSGSEGACERVEDKEPSSFLPPFLTFVCSLCSTRNRARPPVSLLELPLTPYELATRSPASSADLLLLT